jgi:hypothetical protein
VRVCVCECVCGGDDCAVWVCVCVGDLSIYVLVFTVFCNVSFMYISSYVSSVLV